MRKQFKLTRIVMINSLFAAVLLLTACGSSSNNTTPQSSSSIASSSSSAPSNLPPLVDAGDDITVNAGAQVQLQGEASDSDGHIANLFWTQVSGPRVPLSSGAANSGLITFTAPNTGAGNTVAMVFVLTAIDDQGASSTDTATVTVNRINQPPVVQTSGLIVVDSAAEVNLTATAYDPDGSIASYLWQQTAGVPVVIENSEAINTRFNVPPTEGEASFTFTLQVTDNEGATASDTLTVVVLQENAPAIVMDFPPPRGAYTADSISAYGLVAASGEAEIQQVIVNAGVAPVTATLNGDGSWRADNILLPDGVNAIRITAQAIDSENRANYAESQLVRTSNLSIGSSEPWGQTKAMVLADDQASIWLLAEGVIDEDIKLMSVDITSGFRTLAITDFSDETLGPTSTHYSAMDFDAANQMLYLATLPEDQETPAVLHTVNIATGERTQLMLDYEDDSIRLTSPRGVYIHENQQLYVADEFGFILAVDIATQSVRVIADHNSVEVGVYSPTQITWDHNQSQLVVVEQGIGAVDIIGITALDEPEATTQVISIGESISFGPIPLISADGLAIDSVLNRALVLVSQENTITTVDLATGDRTILLENFGKDLETGRDIVFDENRRILYGVAGEDYDQALYAIDPVSGSKVTISTSF